MTIDHETATETDYLRSIDGYLRTIKNIAIWFLVLSIIGVFIGIMTFLDSVHAL